jgi:hypothetical protein
MTEFATKPEVVGQLVPLLDDLSIEQLRRLAAGGGPV